jgi:hypothetical protein
MENVKFWHLSKTDLPIVIQPVVSDKPEYQLVTKTKKVLLIGTLSGPRCFTTTLPTRTDAISIRNLIHKSFNITNEQIYKC